MIKAPGVIPQNWNILLTTRDLVQKTKEVYNRVYTKHQIRDTYIYPRINQHLVEFLLHSFRLLHALEIHEKMCHLQLISVVVLVIWVVIFQCYWWSFAHILVEPESEMWKKASIMRSGRSVALWNNYCSFCSFFK